MYVKEKHASPRIEKKRTGIFGDIAARLELLQRNLGALGEKQHIPSRVAHPDRFLISPPLFPQPGFFFRSLPTPSLYISLQVNSNI